MYVNAWLAGQDTPPGEYPSGGPQPRVMDIWRAAGSAIDLYAPDLYDSHFMEWCRRYHRDGNPLFMPEANGAGTGAANVFYALGEEAGFGFSPFAIDALNSDPKGELEASYKALGAILPQLAAAQAAGEVHGFTLSKDHSSLDFTLGGYNLHVTLDEIFGRRAEVGFGLIMIDRTAGADGKDKFIGLGKGFRVAFTPRSGATVGIATIDEGRLVNGQWTPGRRLNGDENDQGHGWRFDPAASPWRRSRSTATSNPAGGR
jgi:hypothetical protein